MKQKIIAVLLVLLAILAVRIMVVTGKKAPRTKPPRPASVVRTIEIVPSEQQALIHATAVVEANQKLSLSPEIPGRVVWVSPKLEAGGIVKKGEVLIRLDSRDHKLKVKQTEVNVENAQLQIEQENARADLAREEWERLGNSQEASDLVLRVRQQEVARLNLISAESALEQAKLNLSRTSIRAPFNATITRKNVAVGQVVATQSVLAEMVERGDLLAEISLPVADLNWIAIPGINDVKKGSPVTIRQELGGGNRVERSGQIETLIGAIDQQTRRARLLIRIPDSQENDGLPLLPGAFVEVAIEGITVENALMIPRSTLNKGSKAWEVLGDSTLSAIQFERLWGGNEYIVAKADEAKSYRLALTLPEAPVTGMKVVPVEADNE